MNPKARKLAHMLGDKELAESLVEARLDNPRRIRSATNKELKVIKVNVDKVRRVFPRG